jgi:hypothetical protein
VTRVDKQTGDEKVVAKVLALAEQRRNFWEQYGSKEYPLVAKAALRLLGMHATTCSSESNWSLFGSTFTKARNRLAVARAEKLVFIRGNLKQCEKRSDEEVMLDLLGTAGE